MLQQEKKLRQEILEEERKWYLEKIERQRKAEDEARAKAEAETEAEAYKKAYAEKEKAVKAKLNATIKSRDAIGRKFEFPFELCRTWAVSTLLPINISSTLVWCQHGSSRVWKN
jgi:hypothetical protein